jgi:hypothetical protein
MRVYGCESEFWKRVRIEKKMVSYLRGIRIKNTIKSEIVM